MGKQNCELAHNFSSFYFKSETIQPGTGLNIDLSIEKTTDASFSGNVEAAGFTVAGFVTLAATLHVVPEIPIVGMILIL